MKRVLALLLSVVMVLSLAGCKGKDPKTIYEEASKKTAELTDLDMTSTVAMEMKVGDQNLGIDMDMNIRMNHANTKEMKYVAETTTSLMGQEMVMTMYYADGYYYMDMMGQKVKYAMDLGELMEQIKQNTEGGNLETQYMKEITAKKDGDNQILTFTADAEKMDEYVQQTLSAMGTDLQGISYTIKEISGEAVVNKDGYFSSAKIRMNMEMEAEGEMVSLIMDTNSVYNNIGQPVEVVLPDLTDYAEVDPAELEGVQ